MRRTAQQCDRPAASRMALMLALPLAATAATQATGAPATADVTGAEVPGLDRRSVVVPAGELAGHAVQVSEVSTRLNPSEALARVERHWREEAGTPVLRAESGAWSVLSRQTPVGFETLQLRALPDGGSEGLLTQWRPTQASASKGSTLSHLLPEDARVVRQLWSRDAAADGSRTADTLIGRLPHAIDDADVRIERHLRRAGFVAMPLPGARRDLAWRNDRARFYRGAGIDLLVTLHAQPQGTEVVLYHVRIAR